MKIFSYILTIVITSVVLTSCGQYNKVIKSNDQELMYKTAIEYYHTKRNDRAVTLFGMVEHYYTGTAREDTISFYTAVCNFRLGDFATSAEQINAFRRKFNRSPFIEEAEYLLALGYYYSSPEAERDQTPSKMAIMSFNEYLGRYPNSIKREQVDQYTAELTMKLYDKALLNAKVYYNIGYYKSAIHALRTALEEYPETHHREEILYLLTKASYLLAENSIENLQRSRYLDMMDAYYNLASEFPESKHLKEVTKMYETVQKIIKSEKNTTENNNNSTTTENGN